MVTCCLLRVCPEEACAAAAGARAAVRHSRRVSGHWRSPPLGHYLSITNHQSLPINTRYTDKNSLYTTSIIAKIKFRWTNNRKTDCWNFHHFIRRNENFPGGCSWGSKFRGFSHVATGIATTRNLIEVGSCHYHYRQLNSQSLWNGFIKQVASWY